MKLFHTENERNVVYVQMQDMGFICNETDIAIPESIFYKVFHPGTTIINDTNCFNFVRFDKEDEVSFFKSLEFIIDYDDYKDLTLEQMYNKFTTATINFNTLAEKWNALTSDEKKESEDLYYKLNKLEYELLFIAEIIKLKQGCISMPFPEFIQTE